MTEVNLGKKNRLIPNLESDKTRWALDLRSQDRFFTILSNETLKMNKKNKLSILILSFVWLSSLKLKSSNYPWIWNEDFRFIRVALNMFFCFDYNFLHLSKYFQFLQNKWKYTMFLQNLFPYFHTQYFATEHR